MLYNLKWLAENEQFPPLKEIERLNRYIENRSLFNSEHFDGKVTANGKKSYYESCANRISRVVGNFQDVISFPVLLNYQRLMSLKMADLICGEYPTITADKDENADELRKIRDLSDFDQQLYSSVIDISRYGDAVWRAYKNKDGSASFTIWDPTEWFPIVAQDGTNHIMAHVLAWLVNTTETPDGTPPNYELHVQIHWTEYADEGREGTYEMQRWQMNGNGASIQYLIESKTVLTGFDKCAVFQLKSFATSDTVYGYDDYIPIDSLLSEIMTRVGQISVILDKHADPNITGPISMLQQNPQTGEYYLKMGRFFATNMGENEPKYMTWDGQLEAAFHELEFLVNQLYILSELGAALIGATDSVGGAISGTAMRFKLVNPLAKARRTANALTRRVRELFGLLSGVDYLNISVFWKDGLPDDPRETIENAILASGENSVMPLKNAIMEYFQKSASEADDWIKKIDEQVEKQMQRQLDFSIQSMPDDTGVNHPGPGGKVNTAAKGSSTGLNQFHGSRQSGKGQKTNAGTKKGVKIK